MNILAKQLKQLEESYIELQATFAELAKEAKKSFSLEQKEELINKMALENKESIELIAQCRQVLALEKIAEELSILNQKN